MTDQTPDRYVSFAGIDCDGNAMRLMAMLRAQMAASDSRWVAYFTRKLEEKRRMGNDDLYFIGAQMNMLAAFFEEESCAEARALLWELEQTCC